MAGSRPMITKFVKERSKVEEGNVRSWAFIGVVWMGQLWVWALVDEAVIWWVFESVAWIVRVDEMKGEREVKSWLVTWRVPQPLSSVGWGVSVSFIGMRLKFGE